jgi:1-phosphofructokinase family hexose kinase
LIHCTLLSPAIDVSYVVSEPFIDQTLTDLAISVTPAGKGLNVASVVRELGEDVTLHAIIPEIDLLRYTRFLDERNIRHTILPVPGSVRVNTTVLNVATNAVTLLNSAGAAVSLRFQDEFIEKISQSCNTGSYWCFSGSIPEGFDNDVYSRMIKTCNERGAHTLLDSRGAPLRLGLRTRPEMVKPNHTELEQIFDESILGVHHIALKAKRLIDMGISNAFISLGADGMIAIQNNDCLLCVPPSVTIVDTVGCGDALVAGILVAKKREFSFHETCRMAVACGVSKALHRGPGIISRDEVWQLMEDVNITAV